MMALKLFRLALLVFLVIYHNAIAAPAGEDLPNKPYYSTNNDYAPAVVPLDLLCPYSLPASGYPTGLYRTNFTSLTDFCSRSCGCNYEDNNQTLSSSNCTSAWSASMPNFNLTLQYDYVSSPAFNACLSGCTCGRASQPVVNNTQTSNFTYPNATFANTSKGGGGYSEGLQTVNLNTLNTTGTVWTIVGKGFNASNATVCNPSLMDYNPNGTCLAQPTPLPAQMPAPANHLSTLDAGTGP